MKTGSTSIALIVLAVLTSSALYAEEKAGSVVTDLSSTTLNGFVDTGSQWNPGGAGPNLFQYPQDITAVPEPSTTALLVAGASALLLCRLRRQPISPKPGRG